MQLNYNVSIYGFYGFRCVTQLYVAVVWWVLSVCYSVVLSVDVAGFSLGSSYADKDEQLNCCAVAQHAAVWGLLSQPSEHLLEES